MRRLINRLLAAVMAIAILTGAVLLGAPAPGWSIPAAGEGTYGLERTDGKYYTITDEHDKPLDYTAHILYPGDEFITADNLRYRITAIEGDIAKARLVGREAEIAVDAPKAVAGSSGQVAAGQAIAIYHTHSDESYVPSDGSDSIYANGGIFKVGSAFAEKLKREGYNALHSTRSHDPHDANAYVRSRRTAVELLNKGPAALFDVHRDAAPPNVYSTVVDGQQINRVKFVLGTANPNTNANLQFAKEIKATLDKAHPGMIQGILLTRGDFNQDLSPRALLIEVGADSNNRDAAERGVSLFADAMPRVLGGAAARPSVEIPATGANRANWSVVFWIVLVVGGAIAAFLYINAGSWQGAWDQVRRFFGSEWGSRIRDRR